MSDPGTPRPYAAWRAEDGSRREDAAYTFGHDVMRRCRAAALANVPPDRPAEERAAVETAVDSALHDVFALLEGFWGRTSSGEDHDVDYELVVRVRDRSGAIVERVAVSPNLVDLPIGYWKMRDGEFR